MTDRVDDRRQEQAQLQRKQQDTRSVKEKALAAEKFKTSFAQKAVGEQKLSSGNQKKQGDKQAGDKSAQSAFASRQGIAGRSMAERMVTTKDGDKQLGERVSEDHEKKIRSADERKESAHDEKVESRAHERQVDSPIKGKDEQQQQSQGQGQSQGQTGQQPGGGSHGQQQDQQRRDESQGVGAAAAARTSAGASATSSASAAGGSSEGTGKVAIGRTEKMAAKERISSKVLQDIVESIYKGSQEGMHDFHIQLKDDALGGGSLRVTLKDGKLKILFTLKDASAKNLVESSKGVLMRMFERKGLKLETLEVKLR